MSTKKTKFKRTTNFEHCAREVAANNEDIAVVRELISNGYDALSPEIIFGPLPDNEQKGLFCCDFGTGMPLWTSAEEYIDSKKSKAGASSSAGPRDIKKPMDTQGRRCGSWHSFFGIGHSTKGDRSGKSIGHKGQGTKLLLQCEGALIVVSKSVDDKEWGYACLEQPLQKMHEDEMEVEHLSSAEVEGRIEGRREMERAVSQGANSNVECARLNTFKFHVLKPFLSAETGTLIVMLGIREDSSKLYKELHLFDSLPLQLDNPVHKEEDNHSRLLTHLRFKTAIGHPLVYEAMLDAGFTKNVIDAEMKKNKNIFQRGSNDVAGDGLPVLKVLIAGPGDSPSLKVIPTGFPYVKKTQNPKKDGLGVLDAEKNWRMQGRHISSFKVSSSWGLGLGLLANSESNKRVTILLLIDGDHIKKEKMPMLGRGGGANRKRGAIKGFEGNGQARGGIAVGELCGVTVYSQGVYVAKCHKKFDDERLANLLPKWWPSFSKASKHWQLIINGNFAINSKRNDLTTEGYAALTNENVLREIKSALETFYHDKSMPAFKDIVEKKRNENAQLLLKGAEENMEKRIKKMAAQDRLLVKVPPEAPGVAVRKLPFLVPAGNEENGVIAMYSELSGVLQDEWFNEFDHMKHLKRFWPRIMTATSGKGVDAAGVLRGEEVPDDDELDPTKIQQIEFKLHFRIPIGSGSPQQSDDDDDDEDHIPDKDTKAASTARFNHEFMYTDFIICWDMDWDKKHQPHGQGSAIKLVENERTLVCDYTGCHGTLCTSVTHLNVKYEIPKALEGYAFFIANIKDTNRSRITYPPIRSHHPPFITIISLKQLIKATFQPPLGTAEWLQLKSPAQNEAGTSKAGATAKKRYQLTEDDQSRLESISNIEEMLQGQQLDENVKEMLMAELNNLRNPTTPGTQKKARRR